MTQITLCRPSLADAPALLAFELANRAYFESWINARPADYYTDTVVEKAIEQANIEAREGSAHQFLIKRVQDAGDTPDPDQPPAELQIIGRINLTRVTRQYFNKATLGYRIGAAHTGNGYGGQAVAQVLQVAFLELNLWRVEATARPENIGSVKILQKSGFEQFGHARQCMLLHGQWYDLLYFDCHANQWLNRQRADGPAADEPGLRP